MPTGTVTQLRGKPRSTPQAKIDWLLSHQSMWEGWQDERSGDRDPRWEEVIAAMKKDNLVSEKTYVWDIHLTKLIHEARRQRRLRK